MTNDKAGDDEWEIVDRASEVIFDSHRKRTFIIPKRFWFNFAFPIGLAKQIISYKYTVLIFDFIYVVITVFYSIRYVQLHTGARSGGDLFFAYFLLESIVNSFMPPLSVRLLRDIFTDETMPSMIEKSNRCDPYYHLKLSLLCYFNFFGCFVSIVLSAFVDLNPFYSGETIPYVAMYCLPASLALSLIVAVIEGYRLMQLDFIRSLEAMDSTLIREDDEAVCLLHPLASDPSQSAESNSKDLSLHFVKIRMQFLSLNTAFSRVSARYGITILVFIVMIVMYAIYLIWLVYLIESITLKDFLPYITMCVIALCQLTVSLTMVNETGNRVRLATARHVLAVSGSHSLSNDTNASVLLSCVDLIPIQIPFFEGFVLKFRLTAVILGPLIGSIIPRLVYPSS
jgi:hypothetical protein